MKKISKIVIVFSLMAINLISGIIVQAKAISVNSNPLFQDPKTIFLASILDEKGNQIEGAIARIKGREDRPLEYGQTSHKGNGAGILIMDYPINAVIVISKPGYVTQEIKTAGLKQPKEWNGEEFNKCRITVKMIPVKKSGNPSAAKKKKA